MSTRYEIIDCEQGSPEWHTAKLGIPSASRFKDVLAQGEGKMRAKYMHQLAGEIITGEPMETYVSDDMKRGKEQEDDLRKRYCFAADVDIQRVGFVKMNPALCIAGCSPDGWIGGDGIVEFKSASPTVLIPILRSGIAPPEHKAQVQGNLWISGRKWCDLVIGWPKMPLAVTRVTRDETFMGTLGIELKRFNIELAGLVGQLRSML